MSDYIDIVFDGPPGPTAGRFVEVENVSGESINFGEWVQRDDGYWVLRITAADEITRLRQWVDDLQSGMYVNCVYCGHRYGPGETTPVSMADALKEHVEHCPDHPMSRLRAKLDRAREGLEDIRDNTGDRMSKHIASYTLRELESGGGDE